MKIKVSKLVLVKLTIVSIAAVVAIAGFIMMPAGYEKVSASANGPTPGHTNAPGEGNCTACHSDFPVNSGTGSVSISGVPASYSPNQQINVTVTTAQSDAVIYGFQLTALNAQNLKVGTLSLLPQSPQQLQIQGGFVGGSPRDYIMHTSDGIIPTQFGSKSWTFRWTAPAQGAGRVTFYVAGNAANSDGTSSGDFIYASSKSVADSTAPSNPRFTDFDGDGKTDISIFRPAPGEWWYLKSSNGQNYAAQFGASTDQLAPGDFTGDGKADIAFWRPSTGFWFVLRSEDSSFYSFPFGATGDVPVQADYDADGKTDPAVFRPSSATWFIQNSSGGTTIQGFGQNGDVPVPADYDGDGKADIAIYRPSNGQWWLNRSTAGVIAAAFGVSTDTPAQGDYTGDGKADIAFWRPSTGEWFILRSNDFSFYSFPFGTTGDVPVQGDYDSDGKFDAAVFRPSGSTWFIQRSTAGTLIQGFGQSGDVPVPGN